MIVLFFLTVLPFIKSTKVFSISDYKIMEDVKTILRAPKQMVISCMKNIYRCVPQLNPLVSVSAVRVCQNDLVTPADDLDRQVLPEVWRTFWIFTSISFRPPPQSKVSTVWSLASCIRWFIILGTAGLWERALVEMKSYSGSSDCWKCISVAFPRFPSAWSALSWSGIHTISL